MSKLRLRLLGAPVIVAVALSGTAFAQSPALTPVVPAMQSAPAVPAPAAPAVVAPKSVTIPEGTAMQIRFDEKISSATSVQGDRFSVSLSEPVKLSDGTVIPAGYRGTGEVTAAEKRGFMGQAGTLNIRLDSMRIGDVRVPLRASKGQEGQGAMGATIALTVLFGPLGLLKRGHDIVIPEGQTMEAYTDRDADISFPLVSPPTS
jgi:hypothetical protein